MKGKDKKRVEEEKKERELLSQQESHQNQESMAQRGKIKSFLKDDLSVIDEDIMSQFPLSEMDSGSGEQSHRQRSQ